MRLQLRNLTVTAAIAVAMLISGVADRAAAQASGEGAPECYQPIVDPDSRRYVELQIPDVPGVVFGPPRPTCQTYEQTVMPL